MNRPIYEIYLLYFMLQLDWKSTLVAMNRG
jgi:hypothetical protein